MRADSIAAEDALPSRSFWRDYLELSKARIVFMVLVTTVAGFLIATPSSIDLIALMHVIIGTAFIAAGTNALNEYVERDHDLKMERTKRRPLPGGRITVRAALVYSVLVSVFGIGYLALAVNGTAALLALATLCTYLFLYTPLKRHTTLNTLVGAVPGAIPPMIGWSGATGELALGAWILFGIMFLWQIPHFLAISWIYREDYARAGFHMLSVHDPDGRATSRQALLYSVTLIPVTLAPLVTGMGSYLYAAIAVVSNLILLYYAAAFVKSCDTATARKLFLFSNIYLLLLMGGLVASR